MWTEKVLVTGNFEYIGKHMLIALSLCPPAYFPQYSVRRSVYSEGFFGQLKILCHSVEMKCFGAAS